ncbi:hypothetical protein GCM10008927_13640 [Amylibacter ulvae]|uniref:Transcription factor LuxR-like autoinducer-binding domain-containing protein n=1 Tax=Paramylibacter ulvae TaxID=1651968 RepID=A0ABQ3CZN8_9RHOB|nr:hypothetical protein GCM10008927_13640 [Amylibacter ulvae]
MHIRFTSPLITLRTYSQEWQDHYTANVYVVRDPLIAWAFSKKGVNRWSEIKIPDPFNIMGQAAEYGMKYGVAVSCGPLGSRSIGTASRNDREYNDEEMAEVRRLVEYLHEKTEPPESLTQAQQEALGLIAAGPPCGSGGTTRDFRKCIKGQVNIG